MNAPDPARPPSGFVSLVGAGPGDPGLLTVRARALLGAADAVVYDALVNPRIVRDAAVRPNAELHDVGKRGGAPSARQEEINALLVRLARDGKRVVRLKGGDPFVFGRGSEEAQALAAAGVPFEVVPGVTAGVAAPAYAGIPVTHRGMASAVTFVTGHEDSAKHESDLDWASLARAGGTLVLYMGVKRLPDIVAALTAGGLSADTPAAVIEWGTWPRQRTIRSTLGEIVEAARAAGIGAPSITVIGDVARLRDDIAWFDRRPLHGRRILVTRARAQASELADRLTQLGAEVIEAPAITIAPADPAPLRAALGRLDAYQWVLFTSQNAVEIAWTALRDSGGDARRFAGVRVGAVGQATAGALLGHGIAADVIPPRATAESLGQTLRARRCAGGACAVHQSGRRRRHVAGGASCGARRCRRGRRLSNRARCFGRRGRSARAGERRDRRDHVHIGVNGSVLSRGGRQPDGDRSRPCHHDGADHERRCAFAGPHGRRRGEGIEHRRDRRRGDGRAALTNA